MVVRLIIIGLLVYCVVRFMRILFPSSSERPLHSAGGQEPTVKEMVQDPHCGVYVVKQDAYCVHSNAQTLYFCSEDCSRKFLQQQH
jgi:YHS domain-containing protein